MKKRILAFVAALVLLVSAFPAISVSAASYPLIIVNSTKTTYTIPQGEKGNLGFVIFPEYKNERYNVNIYNSNGGLEGTVSESYYNVSSYSRDLNVGVDTADLDLPVGTYTAEYWMEFYSLMSWRTAPNRYKITFKVIENKCHGNHSFKLERVVTEATCEKEGEGKYLCSTCGHNVSKTLPKAHTYNSGTMSVKPTPTTNGTMLYTCTTCGDTKTENISSSKAVHITKQPKTAYAQNGKTAKTTVTATGEGLKYQWYFREANGKKYVKSSRTSSTYACTMTPENNNRRVYCKVTDKYGNTVQTTTVLFRMSVSIKKQPVNVSVVAGKTAKVSVSAVGTGLKYQWYLKDKGAKSFKKSSIKTATYSCKMTSSNDERQVYCKITDQYGKSVTTKTITLQKKDALKITKQPATVSGKSGVMVKTTIKANGDGLKYQWYIKEAGKTSLKKSSCKKATYSCKMSKSVNGRQVYCVVTDQYGKTAKSKTVTLKMK